MEQDQQYTNGFNHGYTLAKYLPELILNLMKGIHTTGTYFKGIIMGKEEYDLELNRSEIEVIKDLRAKTQSQTLDLGRD